MPLSQTSIDDSVLPPPYDENRLVLRSSRLRVTLLYVLFFLLYFTRVLDFRGCRTNRLLVKKGGVIGEDGIEQQLPTRDVTLHFEVRAPPPREKTLQAAVVEMVPNFWSNFRKLLVISGKAKLRLVHGVELRNFCW